MKIELEDYNLVKAEKLIIQKCIDDNTELSLDKQAQLLSISPRTLFRKLHDYDIVRNMKSLDKSIKRLERLGYKVIKV